MGKPGRPKKDISERRVEALASIGCTWKEIALVCECAAETIQKRPELYEAYKAGKGKRNQALRHMQWKSAQKGSVPMQIWLSTQWLGQRKDGPKDTQDGDIAKRLRDDLRAMQAAFVPAVVSEEAASE